MITVKYIHIHIQYIYRTVYVYFFILINNSFQSILFIRCDETKHTYTYHFILFRNFFIFLFFSGKSTVQKWTFSQTKLIYLNIFPLKFALH